MQTDEAVEILSFAQSPVASESADRAGTEVRPLLGVVALAVLIFMAMCFGLNLVLGGPVAPLH